MTDLTEDEKFVLCVLAGAELKFHTDPKTSTIHLRTAKPCGIMWLDAYTPVVIEGRS